MSAFSSMDASSKLTSAEEPFFASNTFLNVFSANLCEKPTNGAGRLVMAIAAPLVEVHAGARDQRDRAFEAPHNFPERDAAWMPLQSISTFWSTNASNDAQGLQVEHNQL